MEESLTAAFSAEGMTGQTSEDKLPRVLVASVVAICVLPSLLNLVGVDFSSNPVAASLAKPGGQSPGEVADAVIRSMSGSFVHTILEWSAFSMAIFAGLLALVHFTIRRDVATLILGIALFFGGVMDAFHTLAADRLINSAADHRDLIPFTWAIGRLFNALIMISAAGVLLIRNGESKNTGIRFALTTSGAFGAAVYGIIHLCSNSDWLPQTMFPSRS